MFTSSSSFDRSFSLLDSICDYNLSTESWEVEEHPQTPSSEGLDLSSLATSTSKPSVSARDETSSFVDHAEQFLVQEDTPWEDIDDSGLELFDVSKFTSQIYISEVPSHPPITEITRRMIPGSKALLSQPCPTEPYTLPTATHDSLRRPQIGFKKSVDRCQAINRLLSAISLNSKPEWITDDNAWNDLPDKHCLVIIQNYTNNELILNIHAKFDDLLHKSCWNTQDTEKKKSLFHWWSDSKGIYPKFKIKSQNQGSYISRTILLPSFINDNRDLYNLRIHYGLRYFVKEVQEFFQTVAARAAQLSHQVPVKRRSEVYQKLVPEIENEFAIKWALERTKIE